MPVILRPIIVFICETLWPAIVRLFQWTIGKAWPLGLDWLRLFFSEKVMQDMIATATVTALLTAWAVFLAAFWNFSSLEIIRGFFSGNPFRDVSVLAGSLYLASHFFPFHFFFGTAVAYIQWRLTVVHAAIVLNRLVRIMQGM
jgi:hypothetical protein